MTRNDIFISLQRLIAEEQGISPDRITSEKTHLYLDLHCSELDVAFIAGRVEKAFSIKFSREEYESIEVVADIIDVIGKKGGVA